MPYSTNLPRRDRPRGLGDIAEAASGLGAWVVDNFWGLSPKNIGGQPRPYGQTVVQTFLPRALQPRLMNLHMGPVIPGGTWPLLRRMNNQPVFRTPVERPGAVNVSLPPGAGPAPLTETVAQPQRINGYNGFGWIPMGVATRPAYLLEPPGMQGYGAYGQDSNVGGELTINALGAVGKMTQAELEASAGTLRSIFIAYAQTYMSRVHQMELFDEVLEDLAVTVPAATDRVRKAELIVFGDPLYPQDQTRASARRAAAYTELQQLNKLRLELAAATPASATDNWPTDLRNAYLALINRQAPSPVTASFGQVGAIAALMWAYSAAKVALGILVAGGVIYGSVKLYDYLGRAGQLAQIRASDANNAVRYAQAKTELEHAAAVNTLRRIAETAPTEKQRIAAMNKLESIITSHQQQDEQRKKDNAAVNKGIAGKLAFTATAIVAGILGLRYWLLRRGAPRRRRDDRGERRREGRRERRRERRGGARELLALPGPGGD